MSAESTPKKLKAVWDTLTIVLFLVLICLPTVDYFFKLDHADDPNEHRLPAPPPTFRGLARSREFITGVENYFNDHFGFRKRLVQLNNHWKGQLFHDATCKDVLIGRNGWLFFCGERMIAHYTSAEAWTNDDLENWRRLLEGRRDWVKARGAKYLLVVPPDKHRVYPECLPDWLVRGEGPSKVEQLAFYLKRHSDVQMLDLTGVLVEGKKTHSDYLKTDTHWNLFGGFVAYRAVIEALAQQIPGLKPLPLDAFTWVPAPPTPGDLARILGRSQDFPETEAVARIPNEGSPAAQLQFDAARFPHQGYKETRTCYTLNPEASGKLMIFRDSFANSWIGFMSRHFREVVYVWQYDWNLPLIEREKPDVVVDEILERFFSQQDPAQLARKDQASLTNAPGSAQLQPGTPTASPAGAH
jgi:alginate O-acetyltransferase complex protein AlgJ